MIIAMDQSVYIYERLSRKWISSEKCSMQKSKNNGGSWRIFILLDIARDSRLKVDSFGEMNRIVKETVKRCR